MTRRNQILFIFSMACMVSLTMIGCGNPLADNPGPNPDLGSPIRLCINKPPEVPTGSGWIVTNFLVGASCPIDPLDPTRKNVREWSNLDKVPATPGSNTIELCVPPYITGTTLPTNFVYTAGRTADAASGGKCYNPPNYVAIGELTRVDGYKSGSELTICLSGGVFSNTPPGWKDVGPAPLKPACPPPNTAKIIRKQ